jgi:rod shape-determining protein MreC
VAKVVRVERDSAYAFAKIVCLPMAGTDQNRQVLVLAQEWNQPPPPAAEADSGARAGKAKRTRRRE